MKPTRASAMLLLCGSLLAALLLPTAPGRADEKDDRADPVPLRRLLLSGEQLGAELKRVGAGVLVRLPRADFEARVRRAALGKKARPPRLVEARYSAKLKNDALEGMAQWKVVAPGPVPALLELQPAGQLFNLALTKQPRWENRDAHLAEFEGRGLALLVDQAGEQTVTAEWSARAEVRPEGLYVDLRLPSCAVASMELDLPAEQDVLPLDGALVSGPHLAESRARSTWKVACSGRGQVRLLVRRARGAGAPAPVVLAWLDTVQKLGREGLEATYSFRIEALHQGVRELTCECDPSLRPFEVTAPGLLNWAPVPGAPSRLLVRLREPLREGELIVRCLAPLSSRAEAPGTSKGPMAERDDKPVEWVSPGARLVGAVPRGESLEIWLHPGLRVTAWQPGGFRLTDVADVPGPQRALLRRLSLKGGGLGPAEGPPGRPPQRPSARLHAAGVDYRARQLAWWQFAGADTELTLQIAYEVSHGQLFQLPVLLPAGWEAESVVLNETGLLRNWNVRPEGKPGRGLLLVELHRPLAPRERGRPTLTVRLRPRKAGPIYHVPLPFPEAVPLGARFHEGALAIDFDEQAVEAEPRTSALAAEPEGEGPWGKTVPDYYYPYQGAAVAGSLVLRPRPPRLRVRASSEVFVASGRAAVEAHLLLEAEVGSPDTLDVLLSAAPAAPIPWSWRVESGRPGRASVGYRIRRAQRDLGAEARAALGVLAARDPLQAAVLLAARPPGTRWRVVLDRPLRAGQPLWLHASRKLEPAPTAGKEGPRWEVPLPSVLGAARMEGEVSLHLAGADLIQVETVGLREAPARSVGSRAGPGEARAATAWRTFRYASGPVALVLRGQALAGGRPTGPGAGAAIDRALLTTFVGADGETKHHFAFRVVGWPLRTLPLRLPSGARALAVGINGRWLERPAPVSTQPGEEGALKLPLPVVAGLGEAAHRFEVVYETAPPAGAGRWWSLWSKLEAPLPVLPMAPTVVERRWRLPPGARPLSDRRYRRLPGPGEGPVVPARQPGDLFRLTAALPPPWPRPDDRAERRQALADAAASLRAGRAGQQLPLRAVVEEVAFTYLKKAHPLVIDTVALREAQAGPGLKLRVRAPASPDDRAMPWEQGGLVALAARSGVLLTSRQQAELWRAGGKEELSVDLELAVAEAAAWGQSPSGRFLATLDWLHASSADGEELARRSSALFDLAGARTNWTEWAPVAGTPEDAALVVVRRGPVVGAGAALAALLVLALFALRKAGARPRLAFVLLWLAVAGLGLLWLPVALQDLAWWPLLSAAGASLGWYLLWARGASAGTPARHRSGTVRTVARAGAVASALAGLLALGALVGRGQPAAPAFTPVYLVPGPGGAADKQSVLVPPALLAKLEALARPAFAPPDGAVLLGAQYEGKVVKHATEFEAVFQVQVLGDAPASLVVPLGDVRLQGDVLVDGARAFAVALPAPQVGYAVPVRGRGRHKVELRFHVAVGRSGAERTVRFAAPRLARSRLSLRLPAGSTHAQALVKHGGQKVTGDPQPRLEVELGAVTAPVQLHWFQEASPPKPARIEFREAYLWDLRPDASTLTALLRYQISGRAVTSLTVELPPELMVRTASAGPAPLVRLRDWGVTGEAGWRPLRLEFPAPVSGAVEVVLELVPRAPLAGVVTLPLPRPLGSPAGGVGHLAYRAEGVEAVRGRLLRVTGQPVGEFAPFWPTATRPRPQLPLSYASTFRRDGRAAARLELHLRPAAPRATADQQVHLRIDERQAELRATATLKAPGRDLAVVEWEIASSRAWTVAAVTGAGTYRWGQSGNRVLVWLEHPTDAAQLTLSAWLPLTPSAPAKKGGPAGPVKLELPSLRVTSAQSQQTTVRVEAGPGLVLVAEALRQLQPLPGARPTDHERAYLARGTGYAGTFLARPGPPPQVRTFTLVEVRDRELTFTATVECRPVGDLRALTLRLRNWEGDKVTLSAPALAGPARETVRPRERTFALSLRPGTSGPYAVTLTGSVPLDDVLGGAAMPDVSVVGAGRSERVVAVDGGVTAEAPAGLTALEDVRRELAGWPGEAKRAGRAWRVRGPDWQLRLLPRDRAARPVAVDVLLEEHSLAVIDGRRWLHEVVYWLRHEAHTDLNVSWPSPVEVVSVSVDGSEVAPLQPGADRLWLPLPGRAGARRVRLSWLYAAGGEALERPNLDRPRLEGARNGATVWTAHVPLGWRALPSGGEGLGAGATRWSALDLARARALLEVSRALVERGPESGPARLTDVQNRFYQDCRRVDQALEVGSASPEEVGAELRRLREENRGLAKQFGFEPLRAEAERSARQGTSSERSPNGQARGRAVRPGAAGSGTPLSWQAGPDEAAPALQLAATEERRARVALAVSGQWLGLLALAWAVSLSALLRGAARRLWPEQMVLLGAVGWHLAGPTAVTLFLIALGIAGRALLLGQGLRWLLRQAPARPASGVVGPAALR